MESIKRQRAGFISAVHDSEVFVCLSSDVARLEEENARLTADLRTVCRVRHTKIDWARYVLRFLVRRLAIMLYHCMSINYRFDVLLYLELGKWIECNTVRRVLAEGESANDTGTH